MLSTFDRLRGGARSLLRSDIFVRPSLPRFGHRPPACAPLAWSIPFRPTAASERRFSNTLALEYHKTGSFPVMAQPCNRRDLPSELSPDPNESTSYAVSSVMLPDMTVSTRNTDPLLQGSFACVSRLLEKPQIMHINHSKYEYPSMPRIEVLLEARKTNKVVQAVCRGFKEGVYLTPEELDHLTEDIYEQKKLAYSLVALYADHYDITAFKPKATERMLNLCFYANNYALFDRLFNAYQTVADVTDPTILTFALKTYLNMGEITFALQLFNQSVLMGQQLPPELLGSYLKDLQRTTHNNVGLCYAAYRLWTSTKLDTTPSTDAFIYQSLKRFGNTEQLDWLRSNLAARGRDNCPEVLWVDLMGQLRTPTKLETFFREEYAIWTDDLDTSQRNTFDTKVFDLCLSQGNYEHARSILVGSPDSRVFLQRLDKLLIHLKALGDVNTMVRLLDKLHESAKLKIHKNYSQTILGALLRSYPEQAQSIRQKYNEFAKTTGIESGVWYSPPAKHNNRQSVSDIEADIRKGINPTERTIISTLKRCTTVEEYSRVSELVYHHPKQLQVSNLGLQTELFWKRRSLRMPADWSVRNFLETTLDHIDSMSSVSINNLSRLLLMSARYGDFDLGDMIIEYMVANKIRPKSTKEAQRLAYALANLFFKRHELESLVRVLENIKAGEVGFSRYLIADLQRVQDRYGNGLVASSEFEGQVHTKLLEYYRRTMEILQQEQAEHEEQIDAEVAKAFEFLQQWIGSDFHKV